MKYNPDYQHRHSTRLKGYDYSQSGLYYITICTYQKQLTFGSVVEKVDIHGTDGIPYELNENAEIIKSQWFDLPNRFPGVRLDQFSIMPDHIHGIISIRTAESFKAESESRRAESESCRAESESCRAEQSPAPTVGDIVCAYKSIITKICNKQDCANGRRIWQRNYFERIIRSEEELNNVRTYIKENPDNWKKDEHYLFAIEE